MYYSYMTTQDVDARKTHIWDSNAQQVLCGYSGRLFWLGEIIDEAWINQPDPDHVLCVRCKRIALNNISKGEHE